MTETLAAEKTSTNGNGTHPDGIGEEDARSARIIGLDGTGQLSFSVGGKRPDTSKVQLVGRSIELPGAQMEKGREYTVQMRIRVGSVHFDDKIDPQTEDVTGCTRKHKARIVGDVHLLAG